MFISYPPLACGSPPLPQRFDAVMRWLPWVLGANPHHIKIGLRGYFLPASRGGITLIGKFANVRVTAPGEGGGCPNGVIMQLAQGFPANGEIMEHTSLSPVNQLQFI